MIPQLKLFLIVTFPGSVASLLLLLRGGDDWRNYPVSYFGVLVFYALVSLPRANRILALTGFLAILASAILGGMGVVR